MAWLAIKAVQGYFVVCYMMDDKESPRPSGTSPIDVSQHGTDHPMMTSDSNFYLHAVVVIAYLSAYIPTPLIVTQQQ